MLKRTPKDALNGVIGSLFWCDAFTHRSKPKPGAVIEALPGETRQLLSALTAADVAWAPYCLTVTAANWAPSPEQQSVRDFERDVLRVDPRTFRPKWGQ